MGTSIDISSNINEVIKTILNFVLFFTKRFYTHKKAQKAPKAPKSTKTQPRKNTKTQINKQK